MTQQGPTSGQAAATSSEDRAFFGHPRGLSTLFFTELWERFSYYGMRAILILFMTAPVAIGGLGFDTVKAGAVYGTYVALVYLLALPGGWVADRLLGLRRAVFVGGIIIMMGHISLAIPGLPTFYLGLLLVPIGTGLLKPNVSALVGTLYTTEDVRRDAGFSIYYMGINIGGFVAPLVVGWLAQGTRFQGVLESVGISPESSWHFGFAMAAIGMLIGLIQYSLGGRHLGRAGLQPVLPDDPAAAARVKRNTVLGLVAVAAVLGIIVLMAVAGIITVNPSRVAGVTGLVILGISIAFFIWLFALGDWTSQERKRLLAILALFIGASIFWSAFEQAGSSLNLFAQNDTNTSFFGIAFPASWFQSINSLFIIIFAPVFAWLWVRLGRRDPSTQTKFSGGLLLVGAGFLVMMVAARLAASGVKVGPMWLVVTYLLHTFGELSLSPVGLSAMTRLAPERVSGLMMGVWFLATSVGSFIAGGVVTLYASFTQAEIFGAVAAFAIVSGAVMALFIRPIKRMLARSEGA